MYKKCYKILKISLLCLIFFVTSLFSCTAPPILPSADIGEFTSTFPSITKSNAKELSEIGVLDVPSGSGPIADLQFIPSKDKLLVAYSGEGTLREWELESFRITRESTIDIASVIGTGFDSSGSLIIAPGLSERRPDINGVMTDYIGGIGVWDVREGVLRACIVHPCGSVEQDVDLRNTRPEWEGASIDPIGRWVISFNSSVIGLNDLTGSTSPSTIMTNSDMTNNSISEIEFNHLGNRYAVVYQNGDVVIRNVKSGLFDWLIFNTIIGNNENGITRSGSAIGFSTTDEELAVAHNNVLYLWHLKKVGADLLWSIPIQGGRFILYNDTDSLIFLATSETIKVIDSRDGSLVYEYPSPQISSLHISPDCRMLFWGDTSGTVHLVAVN
jgi:hypothetical protein